VHSDVRAYVAALGKFFAAGRTGEGAFASVPTKVGFKVAQLGEGVGVGGVGACL
jgi:hypothetical protein